MKKTKVIYWIFTGLFAAMMGFSAIPDIMNTTEAVAFMTDHSGYPLYFNPFIGCLKLLGAIAILVPGFPKIKEWAYAGFAFDLLGAVYSQIAVGDPASKWLFMIIPIALWAGSYIYHHKMLKGISLNFQHT